MYRDVDSVKDIPRNFSGELRIGTISRDLKNGTNSVSERLQRGEKYDVKKLLDPQEPSFMLIMCVTAVLLDPLFFYIPVINDEKRFLKLDKKLAIAASVLRSVSDFFYISFLIFRFYSFSINKRDNSYKIARKDLWRFLIELLAILPLPQVVIFIIMPTTSELKSGSGMSLLKFFVLFQYVPRFVRIYPLFTKATRISSKLVEAAWAKAAFHLLLYMLAAHVFGALWYFFAIERDTVCWMNACKKYPGCDPSSFYSDDSLADHTFINEFCPTKTQNKTIFDFGLFSDALQSGIVEVADFPQKFLHCFFWGLQSLSCLGQNLQTSTYIWEDLFAILITISGLVLFLLLIGNMQTYLQSKTIRSEELRLKMQEIEEWAPYKNLPNDVQQQVRKHQQYVLRKTNGVDVEKFLNNLPRDLRSNIKRNLCLQLLKKVEEFNKLDEVILDELCDSVKPAFYTERRHIVREGEPIYGMLFVMQGKLYIYSSTDRTTASCGCTDHQTDNNNNNNVKDYLENVDFCGEELVVWASANASSSNNNILPISTRSIQALTNVQAFALMANDLKKIFLKYNLPGNSHSNLTHVMHWAASCIQFAWRAIVVERSRQDLPEEAILVFKEY